MTTLEWLQLIIYFVFIFSIIAYATLDGFDLGVGSLHLFAKGDNERRLMINAIGPVWDGNTTWIVIGSGVLLAGFPKAFANLLSGLYTPMMVLIFAFMLRGAAIEFRGKRDEKNWKRIWDFCFFFASLLLALDVGILLGNLIQGLPLDMHGNFQVSLSELLNPYALLVGIFGLSLFMMHGCIYLLMKTEGALHDKLRERAKHLIVLFLVLWVVTTFCTFVYNPHMVKPILRHPSLGIFAALSLLSILAVPKAISKRKDGLAFIASCCSIIFLLILFAIGTFPYIVFSSINPTENSLTLYNCSASKISLTVLTIVSLSGAPLSFFYASYIYRIFRGKIKLDPMSY